MAKSPTKKPAVIKLPVQTLDTAKLPESFNRLTFQFDVYVSKSGIKGYKLVAYVYDKQWIKINLPIVTGAKPVSIKLPVTLGNLILTNEDLEMFSIKTPKSLTLTPIVFKANPHASVEISYSDITTTAKPCPPYCS